jgi:hypothetical protein
MFPLLALAGLALAQDAGLDDVKPVSPHSMDAYTYRLDTCDGVRAIARDDRPQDVERSAKVVVTLQNASSETCLYKALGLNGWIKGTYVVERGNTQEEGFFVAPGQTVSLRITPDQVGLARGHVRLEIAPGRGTVVLIGDPPEEAAPTKP